MPSTSEVVAHKQLCAFERDMLIRHLERRPELDTRAKRLAFLRNMLADHYAAKERWFATWGRYKDKPEHARYSCKNDWIIRENALRALVREFTPQNGGTASE